MSRSAAAIKAEIIADAEKIDAPVTRRRKRLAAALAHPDVKTQNEALLIAGYAPERDGYVRGATGATAKSAQVRALTVAVAENRRDKAKGIIDKSGAVVSAALDSEPDPTFALLAWKTGHDVLDKIPDEPRAGVEYRDRLGVLRKLYRAMLAGARHPELLPRLEEALRQVEETLQVVVSR